MAERILKYDANKDIASLDVREVLSDDQVKVWFYGMPNAAKGKFKIGDGVTTIVSITQQGLQGLGADGSIDALLDQQLATVFDTADGAEDIGKRVRGEKSINLMTNNFVQHPYEMKEVSTNKIIPICATIGAPFDQAKYEADEQSVFLVSDFSEISEYKAAALGADPEGTYNISLMNIKTLETQYKYAKVLFTFNDSTTAVSEFSIDMENTSLLGAINAYGAVSGSKRNISLKTDASKLLPFKGTPIDVTNGLSIFADWFDYDVVMPWFIANLFNTPNGTTIEAALRNLKVNNTLVFPDSTSWTRFSNTLNTVIDIASGFSSSWSEIARYTGSETNGIGSSDPGFVKFGEGNAGKIFALSYVGENTSTSKPMQIVAIESQDQTLVIDNIINTYIKENALTIDSDILKILKQILAALTNYIKSSYCIAGGLNNFHEAYLPWTLRFVDELTLLPLSNSGNGYMTPITYTTRTKSVPKLRLFSRYFNLDASKNLTNQTVENISDIKIIKSDRKITLPRIPLQLQSQTKLPIPKDVSITTATDLQYLWYVLSNDPKNKKFMLDGTTGNTTRGTVTQYNLGPFTWDAAAKGKTWAATTDAEKTTFLNDILWGQYSGTLINRSDIKLDLTKVGAPVKITTTVSKSIRYRFRLTSRRNFYTLRMYNNATGQEVASTTSQSTSLPESLYLNVGYNIEYDNTLKPFAGNIRSPYTSFNTFFRGSGGYIDWRMDGTNAPSGTYGGSLTAYDMDESVYIDVPYFIDNDTVSISEITFTNMLMGVEMFSDDTRNALFTKDKFKNEIVSTFGYKVENIKVSELSNLLMDSIERIELTSVYNDYFILNIANSSYRINFMSSDESIAVRTVVLS